MTSAVGEAAVGPRGVDVRLDASLVRGIAWTSGMKWLSQILSWGCTIAVARMLAPADYGVVGMALLFLELVTLINELGLGAAVVTQHGLTRNQVAQLNTLSVALGAVGLLICCAAALPLSLFFSVPELRWIVPIMGLSCVITAARAVPSALLERELQFKSLAMMEGIQAIVGAVGALAFALAGLRYWALVLSVLASRMVWTGLVLFRRRHGFAWPRWTSLQDALTFSWHVLMSRLSWYAQSNSDYLVAGRVFGKELLGAYTLSFTIATLPNAKITAMVGRVTFPFFSSIQDDVIALRHYLLWLTKGLSLLTFPLACGLALVADEFVMGILGAKWAAAIGPLRCLALLTLLHAIVTMLPQILNVTGESRFAMRVGVVAAVVMPIAFFVGSQWGIVGVATVWITVYPITTIPLYWRVFKKLRLSVTAYLGVLGPAASSSLVMAAVVWMLKQTLPDAWPAAVRLGLEVAAGAVSYAVVVLTVHRHHLDSFRRAAHSARGAAAA